MEEAGDASGELAEAVMDFPHLLFVSLSALFLKSKKSCEFVSSLSISL